MNAAVRAPAVLADAAECRHPSRACVIACRTSCCCCCRSRCIAPRSRSTPARGAGRIGPDFWPKAVIVFMGALALFETLRRALVGPAPVQPGLAEGVTPGPAAGASADDRDAAGHDVAAPEYPRMLLSGAALILGFVVAVDWLGFFVTTVLFLFCFNHAGGFRRPGVNALVALGGALAMVVLFMRVAYISLPLGAGPFRALSIALLNLIGVR